MEFEEEDMVASIRQKARKNSQAYRMKKRTECHAAHRFDLSKVAEEVQIPDFDEVYKLSIQLKKRKSLHVLHKLRMGLSVGGDSVTVFLSTDGALYALTGCLSGNSAEMQREAMNVFINLGLGTSEQCLKLYKELAIYLLIRMDSKLPEAKDACAWCIGNLCLNSKDVCLGIEVVGVNNRLSALLGSNVPRVFQSATYALTHFYATVPDGLRSSEIEGTVQKLIDGLEKFDEGAAEVGWLMFVLSSNPLVCKYMLAQGIIHSVLCALQKVINQQHLEVSPATALLRVLLNCIGAFPTSATQVCDRSEQFVSICKALLYSPYLHVRKETLQLIANVINGACHSNSGQRMVDELNMRPRLECAVRSALAGNFCFVSPTINTNFTK